MNICELCKTERTFDDFWVVNNLSGKKTLECKNERDCANKQKVLRDAKMKADKEAKELELITKWGIKSDDLEELPRLRDASIHYYDRANDRIFTLPLHGGDNTMHVDTNASLRRCYNL